MVKTQRYKEQYITIYFNTNTIHRTCVPISQGQTTSSSEDLWLLKFHNKVISGQRNLPPQGQSQPHGNLGGSSRCRSTKLQPDWLSRQEWRQVSGSIGVKRIWVSVAEWRGYKQHLQHWAERGSLQGSYRDLQSLQPAHSGLAWGGQEKDWGCRI